MNTSIRRKGKLDFNDIAAFRKARGENQMDFWRRFGVTQSGGSRYESGRSVPKPVRLLMSLYAEGTLSDEDLAAAAGEKAKRKKA
jgi:transcriptional regulator with XRE-family HTH domain